MRKRGIVVLRENECAERQETGTIRDMTGARGPRRLREFAGFFIGKMRRYNHSNHYNPHKFSRPSSIRQSVMDRGAAIGSARKRVNSPGLWSCFGEAEFFTIWHRVAVLPLRRNQRRKFWNKPVHAFGRDPRIWESAMTRKKRFYDLLAVFVAMAALDLGASQIYAIGYGGYGIMGGFNYVPSPGDFINSHALLNAGRAGPPTSNNVYAGNPNAFINRIRDNGFVAHAGIVDRRSPGYQASRLRSPSLSLASNTQRQPAAPSAPATTRRPVMPIGSFFDVSRTLVWPSDAPAEGDLITKRNTSDQACLVVSDLVDKYRSAPITTVTSARNLLLAYGQPALQFIRSNSTPRIADSFHQFLLSLYDSLEAAATPTEVASAARPTP
jgi:hypothetical protein